MNREFNRHCIRRAQFLFIILSLLVAALPVGAEEYGRYRAIVLNEAGRTGQSGILLPKVFVIDSKDGHMWILEPKTKLQDPKAKGGFSLGTVLTYQGRVRPGNKMGEIVEQAVMVDKNRTLP